MNKTNVLKKNFVLFAIFGLMYLIMELGFRAINGAMVGVYDLSYASMAGWTSLWMIPIGGICGWFIGIMNKFKVFSKMKMIFQTLIGGGIVLLVEFLSGLLFNIHWGMNLWDYSDKFGNLLGQVCVSHSFLWVAIVPFAIWADDFLRSEIYEEKSKYSMLTNYKKLVTFK